MNVFKKVALENETISVDDSAVMPEVEEVNAEIGETTAVVEAYIVSIEEAEDGIDNQETNIEIMEDTLEDGGDGMSVDTAEVVAASAECFAKRLDIPYERFVPSKEAFGNSAGGRRQATRIAIEAVGDMISNAWEKIKEAFKWVWNKITQLYRSLFNKLGYLEKYADNLSSKLKTFEGDFEEVKNTSIINIIKDNGKADKSTAEATMSNAKKFLDAAKEIPAIIKEFNQAVKNNKDNFTGDNEGLAAISSNNIKKKVDKISGATLVGGKTVTLKEEDGIVELDFNDQDSANPEEAKALSKSDAQSLIATAKTLIKDLKSFEKNTKEIEGAQGFFSQAIDAIINFFKSDKAKEKKSFKLKQYTTSVKNTCARLYKSAAPNAFKAVKGSLDYINSSMK